jgi:peptidoglycan/xylan/chitin deacetylase (PgdA/CDA1 family)
VTDLTTEAAAIGSIAAAGGFAGYAVRGRSSRILAPSFHRGDRSEPCLALSFDDGPSESTPAVLEVLAQHRIKATFFMCGKNVRRLPSIARQVRSAGHEIGNHTDTHPYLCLKSPEAVYRELKLAQETIHLTIGVTPTLFRAPYGVRWFGLRNAQERMRLTGVMWTVMGNDWKWEPGRIVRRLVQGASNGGILCLHDGRTTQVAPDLRPTITAVESAIPLLIDRGFHFRTVSEVLWPKK